MGRRRRKSYHQVKSSASKQSARVFPLPAVSPPLAVPPHAQNIANVGLVHNLKSYLTLWGSSFGFRTETKAHRLRSALQIVVSINAVCVCAEAVLGYFVVLEDQNSDFMVKRDCLKAIVSFLSLVQVGMVVCYWKTYVDYLESVEIALSPGSIIEKGLKLSPRLMCYCIAEVACCLFTLYPGVLLQLHSHVSVIEWSSDDLAYIFILLRSYQIGRLLYWLCPFSDMRTHIFTRVTTVRHSNGFLMRCCVARYGFRFLAFVCGFMILVLGVCEFVFERHNSALDMDVIWNDFWLVAYTLTTIGYGNVAPKTFSGQGFIVISLLGPLILGFLTTVSGNSLNLSLKESDLYSHLLYTREKERFRGAAALTVQQWWRLMKMRLFKKVHAPTIIRFYSQLREYRTTLVTCQRAKDTLFERQIEAFDHSTHRQFRTINEYIQPVHSAHPLLLDLYRNEYRIKSLCRDLYKFTRKHRSYSQEHAPNPCLSNSEVPTTSSLQAVVKYRFGRKAKAKLNAYQNVVGRLIKEEAWAEPSRESAESSLDDFSRL